MACGSETVVHFGKVNPVLKNIALRFGWAPLALVVCLPVTAQQLTPDQTRCRNKGKAFSLDVQISGCTAVLQSEVSAGNRAVAYTNRGIAYSGKSRPTLPSRPRGANS